MQRRFSPVVKSRMVRWSAWLQNLQPSIDRGHKSRMSYKIDELEYYLPDVVMDNDMLHALCGVEKSFLENKIGIKERRIARPEESLSDMACAAVNKLILNTGIKPAEIDLLVLCTENPDYRLPHTSAIIHGRLGLKRECLAFDVNLGCSGFVYCLPIAGGLMCSGKVKNALIITADLYSKIIDYKEKNTASLFGDAAVATILKPCDDGFGVLDFNLGTDGTGAHNLILYNSGVVKEPDKPSHLFMDGRQIFKFSAEVVSENVRETLKRNHLVIGDIKYYVFHQANKYMLAEMQKRIGITDGQMVIDMEMTGNTVSSSIPIVYKNLLSSERLKRGDLIIMCGFGVGLSWGTLLYRHQ